MTLTDEERSLLERVSNLWPDDMSDDGSGRAGWLPHVRQTVTDLRTLLAAQPEPQGVGLEVVAYLVNWRHKNSAGTMAGLSKCSPEGFCRDRDLPLDEVSIESLPLCLVSDALRQIEAERRRADGAEAQLAQARKGFPAMVEYVEEIAQLRARVAELSDNAREGSAAQRAFWQGFEVATLRLFGTNIREAWNSYKAADEFARLNAKPAGEVEL